MNKFFLTDIYSELSLPLIIMVIFTNSSESKNPEINLPPMCDFEKDVLCELLDSKYCSENDTLILSPLSLMNILASNFNKIVEKDKLNNNMRSTVDRVKSIGFTPGLDSKGNKNIFFNPMCSILMFQAMIGIDESKANDIIKNPQFKKAWNKFLAHYINFD